jgi:choice-of-anchor A domain-containing protein
MKCILSLAVLLVTVVAVYAGGTISVPTNGFTSAVLSANFVLNGAAASLDPSQSGGLYLTNNGGSEDGSAFLNSAVPLANDASFSCFFSFSMTNGGGLTDIDGIPGADGIVFIINALTNVVGGAGGGIGYLGLGNSIGVEFDSWYNGNYNDINGNHIGVDINGNLDSLVAYAYGVPWNNGGVHYAWIDFNGESQELQVRVSETSTRPTSAVITYSVDIASILGSSNVYVGFSAGTGGAWENHIINSWEFTNTYAPIVVPPTAVCGNGIVESGEQCDPPGSCCSSTCQFASSSTVCHVSTGPCDETLTCTGSSASCPATGYSSTATLCRASVGPCDPPEYCTGITTTCPTDVNGGFETACSGLAIPEASSSFPYYDVIAFGNFYSESGDIEQRLAVGGNFATNGGWSVGYQINGQDTFELYSLIVAGNANLPSGAVYPEGNNIPYVAQQENILVGGTFTGEQDLAARVTQAPSTLANDFVAGRVCYQGYQNTLASHADNVVHWVQWSGLYVVCNITSASTYYMTVTADELSESSWFSLDNSCSTGSNWVINVAGTDDVTFSGGSFPVAANQVTYNVLGSGRTVNVQYTQLDGNVLAPNNNVNQPSGVIIGKVIANNIVSLQINKASCGNLVSVPSSVCGNGIVEPGEQCDGGICCTAVCTFEPSTDVCRPSVSQCDAAEMCTGSSSTCPPDVNWGFESSCAGLELDFPGNSNTFSFTEYDAIVFGNFNANTGDVERRIAVQGNFVVGAGFSVGYQIDSTEWFSPYSLVVGGNANWPSGTLYPDGTQPAGVTVEGMFVSGTFTGPSYLAESVTYGTAGDLNSQFSAAQSCYESFQTNIAANADNTVASAQWSTLTVTCNSATDNQYFITLTGTDISSTTSTDLVGCNENYQFFVNVVGNDAVTFNGLDLGGGNAPGAPQVVYNIQGSGRTITAQNEVDGSILAPNNILAQTGGVIVGKVVVAEVTQFIQFNKYVCYDGSEQDSFIATDRK